MSRKHIVLILGLVLGLPALACAGFVGSIFASFPPMQGDRVEGGSFVGLETGGSYAWVIPSETGVILVDAGMDPTAEALQAEIGDRPVHAVLVTHGHFDHVAGLQGLDERVVYAGPGESPIIRGEETAAGMMQQVFASMMAYPEDRPEVTELEHDELLTVDGTEIRTVHLPGHTRGSMAWIVGDTVFTGDAALGRGDHLAPVHWSFSSDPEQADESLSRLEGLRAQGVTRLADGHAGLHELP